MHTSAGVVSSAEGAKRSVAVRILGHEYRVRTEADYETVERVAHLVSETMERIRLRTGTVDTLDLAVLAALNLANDLFAARGGSAGSLARDGASQPRLRNLITRVETVLREGSVHS